MAISEEIAPEEFTHESRIHGRSHMHRVMFWADKICTAMGFDENRGDAVAAARLHDLRRYGDGVCHEHGARAAELVPILWDDLQRLFGATNPEAVAHACAVHCLPEALDQKHPHYRTAAILRDADALDRFRLGPNSRPDPDRIHFERTLHFQRAAARLVQLTIPNETPLAAIREQGEQVSNPSKNARFACPDPPEESSTPRETRKRRLLGGTFKTQVLSIVEHLETAPILNTAAKLFPEQRHVVSTLGLFNQFATRFLPRTYMPTDAWEKFLTDGRTKGFWETGPTWHTRFANDPEAATDARAYNDLRLWGEKGKNITYGTLIPPGEKGWEIHTAMLRMYGEKHATWDLKEITEYGSFCVNDSQESPFCLPMELFAECVIRILVEGHQEPWAQMLNRACPSPWGNPRFFEFQIHRDMSLQQITNQP